jgi:hypothetical protein
MTRQVDDRYLLARLRACGTARRPNDLAELTRIRTAAQQAERVLVEVYGPEESPAILLAWPSDGNPVDQADQAPFFRMLSPTDLLVLAVCIRWCWPDPQGALYPGVSVPEAEVLDALQDFSPSSLMANVRSLKVIRGQHKASLRRMAACRYLERSSASGLIALGPMLAVWSHEDVSTLRAEHHRIPGPSADEL